MHYILIICILAAVWYYFSSQSRPMKAKGRCSRCGRPAATLKPVVDGRREIWCCDMCQAELDFVHADRLQLPR